MRNKGIRKMRIYWTLKSIPELSTLGFWERGRAWRTAVRASRFYCDRRWWTSVVVVAACVCAGGLAGFLIAPFGDPVLGMILFYVPAIVLGMLWYVHVLTELVRPHLRKQN
jgi:hypothetical protein